MLELNHIAVPGGPAGIKPGPAPKLTALNASSDRDSGLA